MSGNLMGYSVIPHICQIVRNTTAKTKNGPPVKAWRALSACYILHFVFCQEIITTQEPPFHSVQCTLIIDFMWRNKNMHSSQRAALYIFTRLFHNSGR